MKTIYLIFLLTSLAMAGCASPGPGSASATSANGFAPESTRSGNVPTSVAEVLIAPLGGGLVSKFQAPDLKGQERARALQAEYRALEYGLSGDPVTWQNARRSVYGEVTAAQPYRVGSQDCRQYTHIAFIDGVPKTARGSACRNADGSWTLLT